MKEILFNKALPNVFIASAERTGVAIFRKDLDFARNRMLDELELYYVLPLMMVLIPAVYVIRAKLFDKVRGDDLKTFEEELAQNSRPAAFVDNPKPLSKPVE